MALPEERRRDGAQRNHDFDPSKAWSLGWTAAGAVAVAVVLIAGSLVLALWGLDLLGAAKLRSSTSTVLDLVKLAFAMVAGIGAAIGLVMAYRRHRITENTDVRDRRREAREETRLFNERFGAAAAQLASDQAGLRLAGVYSMAQLGDDWEEGRQQCIDVLCAHLRRGRPDPDGDELALRDDRDFRQTIARIITAHLRDGAAHPWHDRDFDFTGATFDGEDFRGAILDGGTMSFHSAKFLAGGADLFEFSLRSGLLDFRRAIFEAGGVTMTLAAVTGGVVDFSEARFAGGRVDLGRVRVSGTGTLYFCRAAITKSEVIFSDGVFEGGTVDFRDTTFDDRPLEFDRAELHGTTFVTYEPVPGLPLDPQD